MTIERRKFPRTPTRREVEVRFAAWPLFRLVYTMNISKGGMRVELPDEARVGETLLVKLVPPTGPPIPLEAIVRNVLQSAVFKWSVGVEFTGMNAAKVAEIEKVIAAHTTGI